LQQLAYSDKANYLSTAHSTGASTAIGAAVPNALAEIQVTFKVQINSFTFRGITFFQQAKVSF